MIGLPCKCAALGKLSNGTNVAPIFNPADRAKMVFAQDLETAAQPQNIVFNKLCPTTNNSEPSALYSIELIIERCAQ
jgi:hypothetical protein